MMRMKSLLMVAIALTMEIASCTTSSQEENIVIEGKLTNVPDSIILELYEWDGNVGDRVATDTLINGKFRFDIKTNLQGLHTASICNSSIGLETSDFLWIEPGTRIRISGNGLDYSGWNIKSNEKVQKSENIFCEATKAEDSKLHQYKTELYTMIEAFNNGERSEEENNRVTTRIDELQKLQNTLYTEKAQKEEALLETMIPDEAWVKRLYPISRKAKLLNDSLAQAKGVRLYERMDDRLKRTYFGQAIRTNLFPPQLVLIGDIVPDIELKDVLGNTHRLQDLKGKYILIDFWSSGCFPCIQSFPELKEISESMKDKLEVVSISEDGEHIWKEASAKHNLMWNNWNDLQKDNGIFARFDIRTIPHYFLVSPEGKVISSQIGYGKGSLFKFIEKTIAEHRQ